MEIRIRTQLLVLTLVVLIAMTSKASESSKIDFTQSSEGSIWYITNDTVMGGVSSSQIEIKDQALVFSGQLRLENNGGFVSTYRRAMPFELLSQQTVKIRVKGDGREYQLRFRMPDTHGISYSTTFQTTENQWAEHEFTESDFSAVYRGRRVSQAPPLDFSQANTVGFLLADKNPGSFQLIVDVIYQ